MEITITVSLHLFVWMRQCLKAIMFKTKERQSSKHSWTLAGCNVVGQRPVLQRQATACCMLLCRADGLNIQWKLSKSFHKGVNKHLVYRFQVSDCFVFLVLQRKEENHFLIKMSVCKWLLLLQLLHAAASCFSLSPGAFGFCSCFV